MSDQLDLEGARFSASWLDSYAGIVGMNSVTGWHLHDAANRLRSFADASEKMGKMLEDAFGPVKL